MSIADQNTSVVSLDSIRSLRCASSGARTARPGDQRGHLAVHSFPSHDTHSWYEAHNTQINSTVEICQLRSHWWCRRPEIARNACGVTDLRFEILDITPNCTWTFIFIAECTRVYLSAISRNKFSDHMSPVQLLSPFASRLVLSSKGVA